MKEDAVIDEAEDQAEEGGASRRAGTGSPQKRNDGEEGEEAEVGGWVRQRKQPARDRGCQKARAERYRRGSQAQSRQYIRFLSASWLRSLTR